LASLGPAGYLSANAAGDRWLRRLEAALERRYSANPDERFFTGWGRAAFFGNFPAAKNNGRFPPLRESLRESINLPFVAVDARYSSLLHLRSPPEMQHECDCRRQRIRHAKIYLERFADKEGRPFSCASGANTRAMNRRRSRLDAFP